VKVGGACGLCNKSLILVWLRKFKYQTSSEAVATTICLRCGLLVYVTFLCLRKDDVITELRIATARLIRELLGTFL